MCFASPIWLLGLLPWAAVVWYLLPGKSRAEAVPFLEFWRGSAVSFRRTSRRVPPIAIILLLIALLLVVVGSAKPFALGQRLSQGEISIVLDRGGSMALPSVSGEPFRGAIQKCEATLGSLRSNVRVKLVPVPGTSVETFGNAWVASAEALSTTVESVPINPAVADRLQQSRGPVFVLSDRAIDFADSRVVQIMPDEPAPCVAITQIGAQTSPRPQVMVRLENHSNLVSVKLKVGTVERQISLPPKGQSVDQFIDVEKLDDVVTAKIESESALNPWAAAYLVRQNAGIKLVVDRAVPEAVRRIAAVYAKDRQGGQDAKTIIVSTQQPEAQQSGVWLRIAPATSADMQWKTIPPEFMRNVINRPVGEVVTVKEFPARQVWVNGDLKGWEKTADFVIFFGNVFDWLGGGEKQYTSAEVKYSSETWPGVYQDETGVKTAVNAGSFPAVNLHPGSVRTVRSRFVGQQVPLADWAIISALICLMFAALLR